MVSAFWGDEQNLARHDGIMIDQATHVCNSCGEPCDQFWQTCGYCTAPKTMWTQLDPVLEAAYRLGAREAVLATLQAPPYRVRIPNTIDSWFTRRKR